MSEAMYINGSGEMANSSPVNVLISQTDATSLEGGATPDALKNLPIGSTAYTAGWGKAWQLDTDGETWVQYLGVEG